MTIHAKAMSLEERRKLFDAVGSKFFHVQFKKKDGTIRDMTCKKWIKSYLHGEPGQNDNTVSHIPKYYTVAEMDVQSYRNINLEELVSAKVSGNSYDFTT